MNLIELLSLLRSLNVNLWLENDHLRYSAPKGTLTQPLLDQLTAQKEEIIDLLRKASNKVGFPPTLSRISRDQPLPLSFTQQRLWFLSQLEPDNPAYNVPWGVRLRGQLNVPALESSLSEIINRHEILRTRFLNVDGRPQLCIDPPVKLSLPIIDLSNLNISAREKEVEYLTQQDAKEHFELSTGPLLRAKLLQLKQDENVLLLVAHHIVCDSWSVSIFIRELSALYLGYLHEETSTLPSLSIQYVDFAYWQRKWLQGDVLEVQLNYWKEHLTPQSPVLQLPTDHPRPAIQTYRGYRQMAVLPSDLAYAIKTLSEQEGVTLFMTLLTAFKILLYRYTGQKDIVVGCDLANRQWVEIENLIGCFVNTLVLRTDLTGAPSFLEALARVRSTTLGAFAHDGLPFERLVEELQPARETSSQPLFQVMFTLHNTPKSLLELPGLSLSPLRINNETAKFDLNLLVSQTENQEIKVTAEYNTDLFESATMTRLLGHFQALLESAVANPKQSIAELNLLTPIERDHLLFSLNESARDYPDASVFHQLFEAQVEHHPHAIAASYQDHNLSYQELNQQANLVAWHLINLNVGADQVVALYLERDLYFLTAILATFKSGGAYLPLDLHHPPQRLFQVLKVSETQLILVGRKHQERLLQMLSDLPASKRPQVYAIEDILEAASRNITNPPLRCKPGDLAYVIFTSGSTGVPKGAMVEHCGMLNHLFAKIHELGIIASDKIAQTAPQYFDISVWQLLESLILGGREEIIKEEISLDTVKLIFTIERTGITIWETVPALLRAILELQIERLDTQKRPKLESLRWLIVTGEDLPPELCHRWFNYYSNVPVLNAYGPTECSDDVTHYKVESSFSMTRSRIPIGSPISNMRIYVLDQMLHPVPVGITGEIYVGGVGVGRGYLHDPDRTADVFIPDPFGSKPGARLYKTGDLGRILQMGMIEFLGRADFQVKIHGLRIELGDIESQLVRHPNIRETVVIVRNRPDRESYLVAYIVPREVAFDKYAPGTLNLMLRKFLSETLPDYMIPQEFVHLSALPLTPNGKLDRGALPEPTFVGTSTSESIHIAPTTPLEENIAIIWAQVLESDNVGIDNNFFELGGTSLSILRAHALLETKLGSQIPLIKLFQYPTIRVLANYIEGVKTENPDYLDRSRAIGARRRERLSGKANP